MIETPWASVVIPTYGAKGVELTRTCVQTLRETHAHMVPEIFVVSDGDTGDDLEALKTLTQELDVNLILVERRGFAAACNAGIVHSNGALAVFLVNNDIEFIEPCLQVMADAMVATFSGILGIRLLYPDRTIQHGGVVYVKSEEGASVPGYFDHAFRGKPEWWPDAVALRPGLVTGALLGINRAFIERSGILDERFGFTCEDIDLGLRAFECGMQSTYLGYVKAIHHEGASRGKTLEEKMALFPDIAEKEVHSLQFLHQKWVGISDFNQIGKIR